MHVVLLRCPGGAAGAAEQSAGAGRLDGQHSRVAGCRSAVHATAGPAEAACHASAHTTAGCGAQQGPAGVQLLGVTDCFNDNFEHHSMVPFCLMVLSLVLPCNRVVVVNGK